MYQAALYSRNNTGTLVGTMKILKKYGNLLNWKKNESVIELGVGDGRASNEVILPILPNDIKEYIATDRTPSMVEHAEKTIKSSKAEFCVLDIAKQIPANYENRFHHVFSFFMLHWVKEPRDAFKNIYKMLKSDGETFNLFFSESPSDRAFDAIFMNPKWSKYQDEKHSTPFYMDPDILDIYRKYFEDCGFINCVVKPEEYVYRYNMEEFRQVMTSVNPSTAKIPPNLLNEYLEDYLNQFRNSPVLTYKKLDDGQEEIIAVMKCIFMYGKKSKQNNKEV